MTHHLKPVVFLLAFACLLAVAPAVRAGVLMVPASAFDVKDPVTNLGWQRDYRLYLMSFDPENPSSAYFCAPVTLPQGVTPKKITLLCYDNASASADYITLYFYRYKPATDEILMLGSAATTGAGASTTPYAVAGTLNKKLVDNKNYTYYLEIRFPYGCSWQVQFYGAKIEW